MKIKLTLLLLAAFSVAAISCKKLNPTNLKESDYKYTIPVSGTYNGAPDDETIVITAEIEKGPTLRTYLSPEKKFGFILPCTEDGIAKVVFSNGKDKKEKINIPEGANCSVTF